jgi:signal transduction histidine kinase
VELEQVLARLVDGAKHTLQADAAAVHLLDEESAHLTVAVVSDSLAAGAPAALRQRKPIALEHSPLDREALAGRPIIIANTHTDPRVVDMPGDYCSVLCIPLMHESNPIGTLHVYATAPRCFCEEDATLLMPLADIGAAAITSTRMLIALEALEASKAHFIHVATHELRSPVAVAQSLVRGVLKGYTGELTDKQAEVFGRISRRLDFLESLINDLLDLAAGKAPELAEEAGAVAVNASVRRMLLLLQPRAEEKGVALTHHVCYEDLVVRDAEEGLDRIFVEPAVWGTEGGLDRIFVNLIGNAVKYTPPGGRVTVSLCQVGEEIQVEVADTGIGIPEEAFPHLFEEFYRAPNAKALDEVGTGLGLTIVKDLVDRYGGRIEVESTVGQGSTFTVTFPLLHLDE